MVRNKEKTTKNSPVSSLLFSRCMRSESAGKRGERLKEGQRGILYYRSLGFVPRAPFQKCIIIGLMMTLVEAFRPLTGANWQNFASFSLVSGLNSMASLVVGREPSNTLWNTFIFHFTHCLAHFSHFCAQRGIKHFISFHFRGSTQNTIKETSHFTIAFLELLSHYFSITCFWQAPY